MSRSNKPPIPYIETKDMPIPVWEKVRQHGKAYNNPASPDYIPVCFGGSDLGVVMDASNHKSRPELFDEKSGLRTPKYKREMKQDILDAGHDLEPFIARRFPSYMERVCKIPRSAITVTNDTMMYQHPDYPFALANLDRRITVNGVPGILEIKTTGNWTDIENWKKGIVPKKYEWQCRFYMAVMNLDYCYICCLYGFGEDDMAVVLIERDREIEDLMMEDLAKFAECCELGIEPPPSKAKAVHAAYYARLYGIEKANKMPIDLPDNDETREVADLALELADRREELAKLQAAVDDMESEITAKLLKYGEGKGTYMNVRLDNETVIGMKLKCSFHKDTFDEERFKADHPAEYAEFLKSETVEKLDLAGMKKKYKKGELDLPSYVIPGELDISKTPKLDKIELKNIPLPKAE